MKIKFQIILSINILLLTANYLNAKDYRGIIPFHSTKADIIRLLGKPINENEFRAKYESEREIVYVVYSGGLDPDYHGCVRRLPLDTAMLIKVIPKVELKLSDLYIDEQKFRKIEQSYFRREIFVNDEDGIFLRTFETKIEQIKYTAAKRDKYLCPTFQEHPESSLYLQHLPLEILGNVQSDNLQLWLKKFYPELADDPTTIGAIVNYGTDREVSQRKTRILRAFKTLKYDMRRIRIVRGSSKPRVRTEFFVTSEEDGSSNKNFTFNL